jgi:hypothetical protein
MLSIAIREVDVLRLLVLACPHSPERVSFRCCQEASDGLDVRPIAGKDIHRSLAAELA